MSVAPPLKKRPTWNVATTVAPYENVSGSSSVACWLVVFVNGSALTCVNDTFACAPTTPKARTAATASTSAVVSAMRRCESIRPPSVAVRTTQDAGLQSRSPALRAPISRALSHADRRKPNPTVYSDTRDRLVDIRRLRPKRVAVCVAEKGGRSRPLPVTRTLSAASATDAGHYLAITDSAGRDPVIGS